MYQIIEHWSDCDRAIYYGDGIFTTMRVTSGKVSLLEYHLTRLDRDAQKLGLPPVNEEIVKAITDRAGQLNNGVLKVTLSCGDGGRGYARPDTLTPVVFFSQGQIPLNYSRWEKEGVSLGVSQIRLAKQPLLAGIKHLNRLEQVLIKQHMPKEFDDVLVLDTDNHIVECSSANVFWYKNETWYTPELTNSGVSGVMRAHIVNFFRASAIPHAEVSVSVKKVLDCEAMFICNALMGLVPVKRLHAEQRQYQKEIKRVCELRAKVLETL
ncbi:aminodeoxychorismate lyase [Alteromonas sediminis]|uniref:Aminodeoxychorismate lyase n=1 Tax=Alteromonas sediminis TaxID=2259342 RepID=A0A3N5YD08_9ALTE|nr:aminodeoxychorismate lyase [Alteromonas sediminis]RPJ67305.1 aminodeoxychorismate lyase [Alteromonas sediminis]